MEIKQFEASKIVAGLNLVWMVKINGRELTLARWCELLGRNASTVRARINRHGWSVRDALLNPTARSDNSPEAYAEALGVPCFKTWAQDQLASGVTKAQIARRLGKPASTVAQVLNEVLPKSPVRSAWEVAGTRYTLRHDGRKRVLHLRDGQPVPFAHWCRQKGINESTVRSRLAIGWELDRALEAPADVRYASPAELSSMDRLLRASWGEVTKPGHWVASVFGKELAKA